MPRKDSLTSFETQDLTDVAVREGQVKLTIHRAEALEKKDISGLSDPYVAINYRNKKMKTKVCKKTLDPEWNETFLLDVEHNGDPKIELKVCKH